MATISILCMTSLTVEMTMVTTETGAKAMMRIKAPRTTSLNPPMMMVIALTMTTTTTSLPTGSLRMNASASDFIPYALVKRPVPPILPHHQPYITSQQGRIIQFRLEISFSAFLLSSATKFRMQK